MCVTHTNVGRADLSAWEHFFQHLNDATMSHYQLRWCGSLSRAPIVISSSKKLEKLDLNPSSFGTFFFSAFKHRTNENAELCCFIGTLHSVGLVVQTPGVDLMSIQYSGSNG